MKRIGPGTSRYYEGCEPPERKAGRPVGTRRAAEPGSTVCVWLPVSHHDKLVELSREQDRSVSSIVRDILILRLS